MLKRVAIAVPLLLLVLSAVGYALWPAARHPRAVAREDRPPNVLLIVWDTVRADRMGLYGHDRANTPNLERFATQARVYDNAIAPATWTVPSHASLFTGLPVRTHGANARWRWVDHHHTTLAEHLSANGYATYAFSANPYLSSRTNLLQGFDVKRYAWEDKKRAASFARAKLIERDRSTEISPSFRSGPDVAWDQSPFKEASELANDDLTTWLLHRKHKERPWFAFLNLMEAHSPRIPRLATRQKLMDAATLEKGLETDASLWTEVSAILGEHQYAPDELEAMRAVYDATLYELDEAFGVLMQRLEERGALDRTIVVLTSDHGESLGEHGLFEHRYGVYQTLVHVPLVIRYPRGITPGRTKQPVSTANLAPTLYDLLELEPPTGVQLGPSLVDAPRIPVVTQLTDPFTSKLGPFRKAYPNVDFSRFLRTFDAIVEDSTKLIRASDGHHELYDLAADPGELTNLYATHPDAARLLAGVERWIEQVPEADVALRTPADEKSRRGQKEEDAAMEAMLEALGYAEEQ